MKRLSLFLSSAMARRPSLKPMSSSMAAVWHSWNKVEYLQPTISPGHPPVRFRFQAATLDRNLQFRFIAPST